VSGPRRFYVPRIPKGREPFTLRGREARHILRVLRLGPGDPLLLMDAEGRRCRALILEAGIGELRVRALDFLPPATPSPIRIILCQALLKAGAMETVIRKATELGVSEILPFASRRTVVNLSRERAETRTQRWRQIAVEAAKQSDAALPPRIAPPLSWEQMLQRTYESPAIKLILWEGAKGTDLKDLLRGSEPVPVVVGIVGPEGGFDPGEAMDAKDAGFVPVTMGARILRAETAALVLAALLQYEWGDLGVP